MTLFLIKGYILDLTSVVLSITSTGYEDAVLIKILDEIWEHRTTKKSNGAKIKSSHTIVQVVNQNSS